MTTVDAAVTAPLWLDRLDPPIAAQPALDGDLDVDVAIVGGGFSGLWAAYYLAQLAPHRSIAVFERTSCGFGASGRNGGWAEGTLAGAHAKYAALSSHDEASRLERLVIDAVREIERVAASEGFDIDGARGGSIYLARTGPEETRLRAEVEHARSRGLGDDVVRLVDADEARGYLNATRVRSGLYFEPTLAIDPAKLVRGLLDRVVAMGVRVFDATHVTTIDDAGVRTTSGFVRAPVVIRATEAYTRDLAGERRTMLPAYSLMIATEPLPPDVVADIAPAGRLTFADDRHMVIYGQLTADRRIAFGGRGVPYLYGSRIDPTCENHLPAHRLIRETLVDLLPQVGDAAITHRWGGVLGIPRNWLPGLAYDAATGRGHLGGYVGEGVAAANLAGRTMAELVAGRTSERTSAAWVGATSRRWEPEPLRWIGVRGSRWLMGRADASELRTDRTSRVAQRLAALLRGD